MTDTTTAPRKLTLNDLPLLAYRLGCGHDGKERRRSDRKRHNYLQDDEWAMFYATDIDIYGTRTTLMAQVAAAIERRSRADGR